MKCIKWDVTVLALKIISFIHCDNISFLDLSADWLRDAGVQRRLAGV